MAHKWYLEGAGMMSGVDTESVNNHSNETPAIMPDTHIIGQLHIGVIGGVSVLVALIFIAVYIQLVLVLCYGYKLFSYQTVFLFNILLWASLRLTLYSFYYYRCCDLVNNLSVAVEWFLVSAPEILLYLSMALLVHYFMEVSSSDNEYHTYTVHIHTHIYICIHTLTCTYTHVHTYIHTCTHLHVHTHKYISFPTAFN